VHAPTALADKRVQRRGIAGSACAYEQAGAKELRRTAGALTEAEAAHDSGLAAVGAADARRRTFRCPQCALGCCVRVSHGSWLHAICVRTGEGAEQLGVVRGLSRGLITSAHRRHLVILDRIAWKRSARTQARALRGVKSGAEWRMLSVARCSVDGACAHVLGKGSKEPSAISARAAQEDGREYSREGKESSGRCARG
jgi:hypothetical protein